MDWTVTENGVPAPRLIVEYAKFGTMSEYLQSHSVGINDKIDLCLDIASGLQMVHRCGVVHGDMKLLNILVFEVEDRRVAKISDFGGALTSVEIEDGRRYRGTPFYRAPELQHDVDLTGEDLRRCDVFAFGLWVWEILKNGLPYKESEPKSVGEPTILGAGRPLSDLFDMFLESVLGYVPPFSIGSEPVPVGERESGKSNLVSGNQISLQSTFRNLVHRTIHPVAGERYTMDEIVQILQMLVSLYDFFLTVPEKETESKDCRFVNPREYEPEEAPFYFRRFPVGVWVSRMLHCNSTTLRLHRAFPYRPQSQEMHSVKL
jgi:serine/threonine protein kinase